MVCSDTALLIGGSSGEEAEPGGASNSRGDPVHCPHGARSGRPRHRRTLLSPQNRDKRRRLTRAHTMTPLWFPRRLLPLLAALLMLSSAGTARAQQREDPAKFVRDHYTKHEHRIPMRDGARLFTTVYVPKDTSQKYPMLMMRTPYGVRPYGKDRYPPSLGPSRYFREEGFIFVYQDVRGCYLSEGR